MTKKKTVQKAAKSDLKVVSVTVDKQSFIGVGSVKITGDWMAARFSIPLLKRIIASAEELARVDDVTIFFGEDVPMVLSVSDQQPSDEGVVSGFLLAPKTRE